MPRDTHSKAQEPTDTHTFVSKDLAVKPMMNNQYLQPILTADRHYCLRWMWDLTNTGGGKKANNIVVKIPSSYCPFAENNNF